MKKVINYFKKVEKKNYFRVSLLLFVLLFTFLLRSLHSDRIPQFGHLEEHLYGWSGMYLIEEGVPISWSTLDYPKDKIIYAGPITGDGNHAVAYVDLVKPWLDEPPLFSLIVGGFANFFGADKNHIIPSSYLRFPMLFIALFTSLILFLLTQKLFGYWIAIFSTLLWGTVPLFVFSSRLAVPENVISLFYLLSLYLFIKFKESPKKIYLFFIFILPGIAGLMKPTGFFIAPLISFLFFQKKSWKIGFICLIALFPFIFAFLLYGYFYDWDVFLRILSIQGARPAGWNGLTYLLSNPAFDIFPFYDSWYIFSWISAFFFILLPNKSANVTFISWVFIYWVLVAVFQGGEQDLLPWYRYPFFPILAIFLTLGIKHLLSQPGFISSALSAGFLLGNRVYLVNAFNPNVSSLVFRLEFFSLVIPGLLLSIWDNKTFKKIATVSILLMLVIGFLINLRVIQVYYSRVCEAKTCPIGPPTFLTR